MDALQNHHETSGEGGPFNTKFYVRSSKFFFLIGFCDSPQRAADLFVARFGRELKPSEAFTVCERGHAYPLDTDAMLFETREGAAHAIR